MLGELLAASGQNWQQHITHGLRKLAERNGVLGTEHQRQQRIVDLRSAAGQQGGVGAAAAAAAAQDDLLQSHAESQA
jgi:hypothetical protein